MRPGKATLREEAAEWFALMRGPDAAMRRAQFEAWMAADPVHRDAYNRIGETFSLGKALKRVPGVEERGALQLRAPALSPRPAPNAWTRAVLATGLVLAVLAATAMLLRMVGPGSPVVTGAMPGATQDLATSRGEIRTFTLADGSRVTLDTESRVTVSLSATRRDLALIQGHARFAVAHETRPFVVSAAGGSVVARGTVFDIALDRQRGAVVDLIEGAVDVREYAGADARGRSRPSSGGAGDEDGAVTRLAAGHSLAFGGARQDAVARPFAKPDWPEGLRDFKAARLADLLADANRYADRPIVLASGDLGDLEVSGTFGIRDTRRLAGNLADLLGLTLHEEPGRIVLSGH